MQELKFLKVKIEKHPTTGTTLEYLDKNNAIAALILDEKGEDVFLVEQYRPGARGILYEIPAGIIETGESPLETLHREILEETGYSSEDYEIIHVPEKPLILSPGYTTEALYVYIVKLKDNSIEPKPLSLDIGEDLVGNWFKLDEVENVTTDFKTIFAVALYKLKKFYK